MNIFYLLAGVVLAIVLCPFVVLVISNLFYPIDKVEIQRRAEQDAKERNRRAEWDAKWQTPSTDNGNRSRNWFTRRK